MTSILALLTGGDRRSIGRSNLVVRQVLANPSLFDQVIDGLSSQDVLIRIRCADVAEKVSATHPEWLQRHKQTLLSLADETQEKELRWHLAQMLPRLVLTPSERRTATGLLLRYLDDASRIVATFSLQALVDLAAEDARLRRRLSQMLQDIEHTGRPSLRVRARKLTARFQK
jgi:hypothetical protein